MAMPLNRTATMDQPSEQQLQLRRAKRKTILVVVVLALAGYASSFFLLVE
jgi:hypothetical protein